MRQIKKIECGFRLDLNASGSRAGKSGRSTRALAPPVQFHRPLRLGPAVQATGLELIGFCDAGLIVGEQHVGALPALTLIAERFDHDGRRLTAGKILLAGDKIAIPHGKATPKAGLNIVGAQLLHLILDPPRHHMLVAGEKLH
jgi:hypothetical protein